MEKEYKLNRNRKQRKKLREEIKQHEESITPTPSQGFLGWPEPQLHGRLDR